MTESSKSEFVEVLEQDDYVMLNLISENDLNSLSIKRLEELKSILVEIENNANIRVVFFKSNFEKAFIAGADLKELDNQNQFDIYNAEFQKFMIYLREYPKLTVALMNGIVYGGGFELTLACDFRISSQKVDVRLPETSLGIIPGGLGTQLLPLLVGESLTKRIIILNEKLDSELLVKHDLVYSITSYNNFEQDIISFMKSIRKGAVKAQEFSKAAVQSRSEIVSGSIVERLSQSVLFTSHDKSEGINSFLNKRSPNYLGE